LSPPCNQTSGLPGVSSRARAAGLRGFLTLEWYADFGILARALCSFFFAAIFLVVDPDQPRNSRQPPPELATLRTTGDVVTPVLDEKDWGFGA